MLNSKMYNKKEVRGLRAIGPRPHMCVEKGSHICKPGAVNKAVFELLDFITFFPSGFQSLSTDVFAEMCNTSIHISTDVRAQSELSFHAYKCFHYCSGGTR